MTRSRIVLLTVLLFGASLATPGGQSFAPACPSKIQSICDAYANRSTEAGRRELDEAIARGLGAEDPEVREQTVHFLGSHLREFDPRPFTAGIQRYDDERGWQDGRLFLADAALYYSSREARRAIYEQAIVTGTARYGGEAELSRGRAIHNAAIEGFGELRSLIEEYWPKLTPEERSSFSLDRLDAQLTFFDGAENDDDGTRRATKRLGAMPGEVLAANLDKGEGYRQVVGLIMIQTCSDGGAAKCTEMKLVLERQQQLLSALRSAARETHVSNDETTQVRQQWVTKTGMGLH